MTKLLVQDFFDASKKTCPEFDLSSVFEGFEGSDYLIKDAVVAKLAEKRSGNHKAKTRAEVSYSTRKLYRQKGTGNARAGSAKSNIRYHGGVTFGPVTRSHAIKMNKKAKILALKSALLKVLEDKAILLFDSLDVQSHKTKELKKTLHDWKINNALIVNHEYNENLDRASRNIPSILAQSPMQVNVYDLLYFEKLLITKEALQQIIARLA